MFDPYFDIDSLVDFFDKNKITFVKDYCEGLINESILIDFNKNVIDDSLSWLDIAKKH